MNRHCTFANAAGAAAPSLSRKAADRTAFALKSLLLAMVLVSSLGAAPRESTAPASPTPPRRDYASFKPITDKNIFNATRSSRTAARPRTESRRPSQVDTLTLVGTLSYEKGPYAFFDGSSAEYRTVLEPGKTIAGYKIAEITGTGVTLEAEDITVELRVGMQMRREDGQEWRVTSSDSAPATPSSATESSAASSGGDTDEENDIIKRLMQKREQELK